MPQKKYRVDTPDGRSFEVLWDGDGDPSEADIQKEIASLNAKGPKSLEEERARLGVDTTSKPSSGRGITARGITVAPGKPRPEVYSDIDEKPPSVFDTIKDFPGQAISKAKQIWNTPLMSPDFEEEANKGLAGLGEFGKLMLRAHYNDPLAQQEIGRGAIEPFGEFANTEYDPRARVARFGAKMMGADPDALQENWKAGKYGAVAGGLVVPTALAFGPKLIRGAGELAKPRIGVPTPKPIPPLGSIEPPPIIARERLLGPAPKDLPQPTNLNLPFEEPPTSRPTAEIPPFQPRGGIPLTAGSVAEQRARAFAAIDSEAQAKIFELKMKQSEANRAGDISTATALDGQILSEKIKASTAKREWQAPVERTIPDITGVQPELPWGPGDFLGGEARPSPFDFTPRGRRPGVFTVDPSGNVLPPDRDIPPGTEVPAPERPLGAQIPELPQPDKSGRFPVRDLAGRLVGKATDRGETNLRAFENYPPDRYSIGETRVITDTAAARKPTPNIESRFPQESIPEPELRATKEPLDVRLARQREKALGQPESPARSAFLEGAERKVGEFEAEKAAKKAERANILKNVTAVEKAKAAERFPHLSPEDAVIRETEINEVRKAQILERGAKKAEAEAKAATRKAEKDTSTTEGRFDKALAAEEATKVKGVTPEGGTSAGMFNLQKFYERLFEARGEKATPLIEKLRAAKYHVADFATGRPVAGFATIEEARLKAKAFNKVKKVDVYGVKENPEFGQVQEPVKVKAPKKTKVEKEKVERFTPKEEEELAPINLDTPYGKFMARLRENIKTETSREFDVKRWRAEQAQRVKAIETTGEAGHIEKLQAMQVPSPKGIKFKPLDMPQYVIDDLIDLADKEYSGDIFSARRAAEAIRQLNKGEYVTPANRHLVSRLFPEQYRKEITNLYSNIPWEHVGQLAEPAKNLVTKMGKEILKWTYGSTKTLKAAFDASFVGIQGRGAMNTRAYWGAFKEAAEAFRSQEAFDTQQARRYNDSWYDFVTEDMGVHLGDLESQGLEQFSHGNRTLENLAPVKKFHRSAISFLNHVRFENAKLFAKLAKKKGIDVTDAAEMKSIGRFVNESTGHGSLNKTFAKGEEALGHGLWSPRLTASRINYLKLIDPREYTTPGSKFAQKRRVASAVTILGGSLAAMKLLELAGGKSNYDPLSTKFGKSELAGQMVDTTAGFGSLATLMARIATGKLTDSRGRTRSIVKGEWGQDDAIELIGSYFENKANPQLAYIAKLLRQTNPYTGKPYNIPAETLALSLPLFVESVYDAIKSMASDDPQLAELLLLIPGFGGINTYEVDRKKKTTLAEDVVSLTGYKQKPKEIFREQVPNPFGR